MKTHIVLIRMVSIASLLVGCGDNPQASQQIGQVAQASQGKSKAEPASKSVFMFKGFYIGMPVEEVKRVMTETHGLVVSSPHPSGQRDLVTISGVKGSPRNRIDAYISDDGKLFGVRFLEPFANESFNVYDLDQKSFAQALMDAYGLPNMEPIQSRGFSGWHYTDSVRGFEIAIVNGKDVTFKRFLKDEERTFSIRGAVAQPPGDRSNVLNVQGFYIGMKDVEMVDVMKNVHHLRVGGGGMKLQNKFSVIWGQREEGGLPVLDAYIDGDGTLFAMEMTPLFVNTTFNVADLDVKGFAKKCMESYGLSGMEATQGKTMHGQLYSGWHCADLRRGCDLAIFDFSNTGGKWLSLKRIVNPAERNFN